MRRRPAFSLAEIAIAALIIGVSAIPVIELLRATTATFEVNEIEACARALAADVMERFSGAPALRPAEIPQKYLKTELPFDQLIIADPTLSRGYPMGTLEPLLRRHRTTVILDRETDVEAPAWGKAKGADRYRVTVRWMATDSRSREVTLVRIHARR